jgi:hypothetical protein
MQAARRWLLASPDKVPHYISGQRRSGTLDGLSDLAQLATYEEARATLLPNDSGWLLGFALGPDDAGGCWQGIDFDNVTANGLADLANCVPGYVEISPSEAGAHAIGYGESFATLGPNGTGIEAYAATRYFTVTEHPIRDGGLVCLAGFVRDGLAPRHRALRQPSGEIAVVSVPDATKRDLRSALQAIPADDYHLWVRIGLALAKLGAVGRALWLEWSSCSEKFDAALASGKWATFHPSDTRHQAVFAEAARRGWINPRDAERIRHGAEVAEVLMREAPTAVAGDKAQPVTSARQLVSRSLGGVAARAIDWLWTGWMPKGYITIFAGESGAGKSTVLADIAARVTTGRPWPGEPEHPRRAPGRVLWLGSEDGIEEMTIPRLMACGADLNNVIEIQGVSHQGKRSTFSMQDDIEDVERTLAWARDDGLPFAMLVIDPVTSYLPGQKLRKVDLNDAGQLRTILEPWLPLAQRHNIAVVCVTHFGKDTTRSMLHRVMGSAAFAQTCRSLCAVVEREATDEYEPEPHEKALIQVKVNLPEHPGGSWRFVTEKVEVGVDDRTCQPIAATRPCWLDLDGALSAKTAVGPARGPKSQKGPAFGLWVQGEFAKMKPGEWVPVAHVKGAAIRDVRVSESWWNKHSSEYLERQNLNGTWVCRPLTAHPAAMEGR